MKIKKKNGKVSVTLEYAEYAMDDIKKAAHALGWSEVKVVVIAHRAMIALANHSPVRFATLVRDFEKEFVDPASH